MGTQEESKPEQAILLHLEQIAVEGHEVIFGALSDVLKSKGIKLTRLMFCAHCVSTPIARGLAAILKEAGRERLSEEKLQAEVAQTVKDAFLKKKLTPSNDVTKSLHKQAGNGTVIGAVSMFDVETAQAVAERVGLADILEKIEACGPNGHGRPTTDTWLRLAKGVGVIPPRCISIASSGDACRSALFAGTRCIAYASASTAHQDFGGADTIVSELSEIPKAVTSILDRIT
ncbi:MAG: hypothetical protein QGI24_06270 [Kiritimatiellia bacterium]|jgi:beta-phosphoglucomutase-like phosphatase (HAD superfamily)|nr:hypothetical protein [Kiritimatiellia bacterium]MDP6848375.1 hypothetical protein [Kiritimatiellia bacterium]